MYSITICEQKSTCNKFCPCYIWCRLLCKSCNSGNGSPDGLMDVLHLHYPLPCLQEEVHKRTSYLGKHRNNDKAPHLLDVISMTKDETDLFMSFARTAMQKVFTYIGSATVYIDKAYRFETNPKTIAVIAGVTPTITYQKLDYVIMDGELYIATDDGDSDTLANLVPTKDYRNSIHYLIQLHKKCNRNYIEPLEQAIFDALVYYIIWQWLLSAYPDNADVYKALFEEALADIRRYINLLFPAGAITNKIPRIL